MMHRTVLLFILVMAVLALGCQALAQTATGDYIIGVEDQLEVSCPNHGKFNRSVVVMPNGRIAMPGVGELAAAGKSPKNLADEIKAILEKTLNNVVVYVTVAAMTSKRVRIVGSVKQPGNVSWRPGFRVVDALAAAQGTSGNRARISGKIVRGQTTIPIDIIAAMGQPEGDANKALEPDDLILLDEAEMSRSMVFVWGQVGKPGSYELEDGMTLLPLIAKAGNPTDKAALSKVYVLRGADKISTSLVKLLSEGQQDELVQNFRMQPGDSVFLPESDIRYAVVGEVMKPGYFTMPEKAPVTVLEALTQAGGQTDRANLRGAGIIRMKDGKPTPMRLDFGRLARGDLSRNVQIEPNDIIFVPSKGKRGPSIGDILNPLYTLRMIGLII